MSQSHNRDELDEFFRSRNRDKTGYSEELPHPKQSTRHPSEEAALPPGKQISGNPPLQSKEAEIPNKGQGNLPATQDATVNDEAEGFVELRVPDFSEEIPADPSPGDKAPVEKKRFTKVPSPRTPAKEVSVSKKDSVSPVDNTPKPVSEAKPADSAETAPQHNKASVEEKLLSDLETPSRPGSDKKVLLKTNGLVKIYDGRTVVNGVEINVRPGEIVGLLGPNGAGKTTSFYMIVGLVPPNGGTVEFDNQDVTELPMYQRARLGMGYLPQEESIFRKLTVQENIMAVMETLDLSKKERKSRTEELLERFSITHIRNNLALTCSGGEKRRLTIARSLVTDPTLLMLDEPFSGVDPIAVNEIQSIVEDLRKSGLAILITDHNARQTLELVDRAYLIYEGKVLREGHRDFLINDPVSRKLYLGDGFTM